MGGWGDWGGFRVERGEWMVESGELVRVWVWGRVCGGLG